MSVIDYNTKIKEICDALGSINVMVDEDEMVQICLGGLAQTYGPIRKAICTQEKSSLFFNLQSMLMVEENHASGSRTTQSNSRMLYTEAEQPVRVGNKVDRQATVVAAKSRKEGTNTVPTTVPDPQQAVGIKAVPGTGKQSRTQSAG